MGAHAADLYGRMTFERPRAVPNGLGGQVVDFVPVFEAHVKMRYLRGSETVIAARLAGKQPVVATVRRSRSAAAVTPEWRMRDLRSGLVYNIRAVVPSDDRRWIEITAESGVAL